MIASNVWNFEILWVLEFFLQSELKKIILVKSSLCDMRFNLREMGFTSHQCDSSLPDIYMCSSTQ